MRLSGCGHNSEWGSIPRPSIEDRIGTGLKKHLYTVKLGLESCNVQRSGSRWGASFPVDSLADQELQGVGPTADCRTDYTRESI